MNETNDYCANCGRYVPTCPDCGKRFCGETCRLEHTELGSCPDAPDAPAPTPIAAAEARGYARAVAASRDDRLYQEWCRRWRLDPAGPRSYVAAWHRDVIHDYLEWAADYLEETADVR